MDHTRLLDHDCAEAFYCWVEDRPMPPWQIALSIIFAVVVMALCLFPLAPYKLRLAVVYCFLGLLGGIFALILFRFVLFMLVFTVSGQLSVILACSVPMPFFLCAVFTWFLVWFVKPGSGRA